jgi:hypothetical protein
LIFGGLALVSLDQQLPFASRLLLNLQGLVNRILVGSQYPKPVPPTTPILSIHIPKTAGTSLFAFLKLVYLPEQIASDSVGLAPAVFVQQLSPATRIIHGHFHADKYDSWFPDSTCITWLRNPVSRLISHYYFWKEILLERQNPTAPDYPICKAVREGNATFRDFIEDPTMQNTIKDYLGSRPLTKFAFVGIQEYFTEDLPVLCTLLNWPVMPAPRLNENPSRGYHKGVQEIYGDRELIRRAEYLNRDDLDLYHSALKLRKQLLCRRAA